MTATCHVICDNDAVLEVIVGDKSAADKRIQELSELVRKNMKAMTGSYEGETGHFFHSHEVPIILASAVDVKRYIVDWSTS